MTGFFQQYLQMALAGSLGLVVLLFARLLLKRMPKRFMCFLWMIALFRLLCPYTIEGPVPKFWEREASIEDAGQTDTEGVVQRPVTVREPLREQQMGQDWRPGDVMQGIISNIQKYSQENTRVFVSTEIVGENVRLSLMNTSKDPINMTPDRLMERFVRGDLSRHTEGNGLGLAIVKSLVELQNARIWLDVDGDLFKVFLEFPLLTEEKTDSPKEESAKEL